jgi:hypothetical protein
MNYVAGLFQRRYTRVDDEDVVYGLIIEFVPSRARIAPGFGNDPGERVRVNLSPSPHHPHPGAGTFDGIFV